MYVCESWAIGPRTDELQHVHRGPNDNIIRQVRPLGFTPSSAFKF